LILFECVTFDVRIKNYELLIAQARGQKRVETLEMRDDPSDEEEGGRAVVRDAYEDEFDVSEPFDDDQDPELFPGGVEKAAQSTPGPRRACEVVSDFEERNEVLDADYENMKAMMQGMEFEKD
jgi:hypothetical protein